LIDLHCHLLPGLDDGAEELEIALEMARLAAADGITTAACTPHILPGVYDNSGPDIRAAVEQLQSALADRGISLTLVAGADIHMTPDLIAGLRSNRLPTLGNSRYFLLEPPHHAAPPHLEDYVFSILSAGYVPIVTHPERFAWVEMHYADLQHLASAGAMMQITGASLTGGFGRRARYWSERMLDEGIVDLLASDGHGATRRPPVLSDAFEAVAQRQGEGEARRLTTENPQRVLSDQPPDTLRAGRTVPERDVGQAGGMWRRVFARGRR
jgi:protein-tyrosine phosphatase